jgi:hypothetical protein
MKESLKTEVIVGNDEKELEVEFDGGVLHFKLEGKTVFSGDFAENFDDLFAQALKYWGYKYKVIELTEKELEEKE